MGAVGWAAAYLTFSWGNSLIINILKILPVYVIETACEKCENGEWVWESSLQTIGLPQNCFWEILSITYYSAPSRGKIQTEIILISIY